MERLHRQKQWLAFVMLQNDSSTSCSTWNVFKSINSFKFATLFAHQTLHCRECQINGSRIATHVNCERCVLTQYNTNILNNKYAVAVRCFRKGGWKGEDSSIVSAIAQTLALQPNSVLISSDQKLVNVCSFRSIEKLRFNWIVITKSIEFLFVVIVFFLDTSLKSRLFLLFFFFNFRFNLTD